MTTVATVRVLAGAKRTSGTLTTVSCDLLCSGVMINGWLPINWVSVHPVVEVVRGSELPFADNRPNEEDQTDRAGNGNKDDDGLFGDRERRRADRTRCRGLRASGSAGSRA